MANQLGRFAPTLAGYLSRCHNPADVHTLSAEVSAVNSGRHDSPDDEVGDGESLHVIEDFTVSCSSS